MPRIAGVRTKRNAKGVIREITIDAKKHPEAIEILKGMGLIEKSPLQREVDENPDKFSTVDEVFDRLNNKIKSWEWP